MKRFRLIFFVVYGAFHLGLTIVALYADHVYSNSNFNQLIELGKRIPMAKWLALFGCLLFVMNVGLVFFLRKSHSNKIQAIEKQKNEFKAKMFDMQSQKTTENSPSKADTESEN